MKEAMDKSEHGERELSPDKNISELECSRREFLRSSSAILLSLALGGMNKRDLFFQHAFASENTTAPVDSSTNSLMQYRTWPRGSIHLSTVGLGASNLRSTPEMARKMIDYAIECGINLVDLVFTSEDQLDILAASVRGRRDKLFFQMHFGLIFERNGQYRRSRDMKEIDRGFRSQLRKLGTDYADIGLIHCVDEESDFNEVFSSGGFDYALQLKREGVIRHLGFASHNVNMARKFIQTGEIDLFMFSTNPAYDFDPAQYNPMGVDFGEDKSGIVSRERMELYQECEKLGIGINVMKPFGAGRLLDARTSPFQRPMTIPQCLQYCLDRPAVLSCLVGARNQRDLEAVMKYYSSTKEERDYAFVAGIRHVEMTGKCVYCNHCLPCPSNIDIGMVSRYLDLALVGDELAKQHYDNLEYKASDCIECGECEKNCPFTVSVIERMQQAVQIFGV